MRRALRLHRPRQRPTLRSFFPGPRRPHPHREDQGKAPMDVRTARTMQTSRAFWPWLPLAAAAALDGDKGAWPTAASNPADVREREELRKREEKANVSVNL